MEMTRKMNAEKVKWIVTILLPAILLVIPQTEFYNYNVKMFLAATIFAILLAAFELIPTAVIGLLLTGLYIGFNVASVDVIMSPWLGTTLYMVLGGYALAGILDCSGILKRVAFKMMSKVGSNYMALLFTIFFTGVVLTILTFGRGYIILAALCLGLCRSLDIMDTKLTVGIAWACMSGAISAKTFVYCVSMYAVIVGAGGELLDGFSVTFLQAIGHNWPMAVVSLIILFIIGKWYGSNEKLTGRDYFIDKYQELGPMSAKEKSAAVFLVVVFTLLCTESIHGISNATVFILLPWLVMLPIFQHDAKEILKTIDFSIMFFIAACLSIGSVASALGFGQLISDVFVPLLAKTNNNIFFIFGGVFAIVFFLNFVMTPMAIWGLFTAPLMQIVIDLGLNVRPFVYALGHCAEAVIMPYEYTPYLIVYSFGMISMKDFIKTSCVRCTIYFLGFLLFLVPYWMLIGLL